MTPEEKDTLRKKIDYRMMMDERDWVLTDTIMELILEERERCAKMADDRARALQDSDRVEIFAENELFHLAENIRKSRLA